jgi:hypothetical protein
VAVALAARLIVPLLASATLALASDDHANWLIALLSVARASAEAAVATASAVASMESAAELVSVALASWSVPLAVAYWPIAVSM